MSSLVSYYDCLLEDGRQNEHSYMDAPFCPWCHIARLEHEVDRLERVIELKDEAIAGLMESE